AAPPPGGRAPRREPGAAGAPPGGGGARPGPPPPARPPPTRDAAPERSAADQRAAKKELQRIERQLDKISAREATLHTAIAENATDFAKVAELDAELRDLAGQRDELELRWLELAEDA
ncbi:ABC transporter C-terminal domain-containing protein, partial [Streptomyces pseudogriseolus]|uniref:ABC transporter C-terminal domain-containing protein n=1 Tax=Streptomyces pseudogriseolus TaxID=36817 RepID=UPI003FA2D902